MLKMDFWQNLHGYKILEKLRLKFSRNIVSLKPKTVQKGSVLLSYITLPFVIKENFLDAHTNRWECRTIVNIFLEKGYAVDVIDWTNTEFIPVKKYDYFLDIGTNLERLAPVLGESCMKILHLTGSFWEFHNQAEIKRIDSLQQRRRVKIKARRQIPANKSIEFADYITLLGNKVTEETYMPFTNKPIFLIPLSTTHTYEAPANKNFEVARNNFIWFGGSGLAHKGLDLVLEAFAIMPEYHLTIAGKISNEKDFEKVYYQELYNAPNIKTLGLMDPGSRQFKDLIDKSIALVYPSSSEGQSGAVITAMHAGLIPILSRESGVNIENFGIILRENTVEKIRENVRLIASMEKGELKSRALDSWRYANEHHTRGTFAKSYKAFIDSLESK